jgi:CBS domain-containing protein
MEQKIASLMSTLVTTVQADDTVETVSEQLRRDGLSFVPVVERKGDALLGIITAADLLEFQAARRDPAAVQAWEICSYKPVEVEPDATVAEVARLMVERQVHHVVVVDNKTVRGVVSSLDFVKQFVPGHERPPAAPADKGDDDDAGPRL